MRRDRSVVCIGQAFSERQKRNESEVDVASVAVVTVVVTVAVAVPVTLLSPKARFTIGTRGSQNGFVERHI
jgi:hypothetical protein